MDAQHEDSGGHDGQQQAAPAVRVAVVQPSLAKYRVPVFRELASRDGIDLTVYFGVRNDLVNVEADGFKAVPAPLRRVGPANRYLMLHSAQWDCANRRLCDVLILNWTSRYATLLPALLKARANGVPTILWGHGFSKQDRASRRFMRKFLADRGTAVLFYDELTAQRYLDEGWDPARVFIARNTVEQSEPIRAREEWASQPERLEQFQQEQGLHPGQVLLFLSRLDPANRVDLLVQATARLKEQWPDIKTVVIGNGDEERERLREMASELGVQSNVLLLPGIYNESELAPWFLSADAYCYPENIGLSIIHAMTYGVPVVTSDRRECHNPEIAALEPGVNGLTYPHGSLDGLCEILSGLLSDPERRGKLARNAMETVTNRYRVSDMVDGFEAAIRYAHSEKPK